MADERSRVLTLVFTDLADSTALKTERGDVAVGELISRHRAHVTRLAEECSGRIIDWAGDGCFLTFETPTAGVLFALRLQNIHAEESDLPGVRMGVHLGEITEKPGPGEAPRIEGLAVDVAARISGLARPGQVLMSSAVYNSARQRMGVEAMGMPLLWQLHGTYALKGFDTPLEIAEAGLQGVAPLEAPKASEKARLVKKARRQPQQFKPSSSRGVPTWAFGATVMALMGIIVYLFLGRPTGPAVRAPADAPIRSLAVLPFENLMGDASKEYFVDGMTDTLTAELSKIGSIKVIARTSAMRFKNSEEPLSEIARQLGVEGLIEGSVQQFGDEVRITAQLIDGRTEAHLWGDNFEGTLAGVMKLQGEVAVSIADQIGAVLTPEERDEYASAKDVNPEAYDLYLQGRSIMQSRSENDFRIALDLFEKSASLDPEFALPHSGMADVYSLMPNYGFATLAETQENAFKHARRAVELDDALAEAYSSLGWAYSTFDIDRNWAEAERLLQRAVELNPGAARAGSRYGWLLTLLGRNSEAVREMRLGLELDPLDPLALAIVGRGLYLSERYEEAENAFLRTIEMDPMLSYPFLELSRLYWRIGRFEEALEFARKNDDLTDTDFSNSQVMLYSAALNGIESLRALAVEVEQGEHDEFSSRFLTDLYFAVGDVNKSLNYLDEYLGSGNGTAMDLRVSLWVHSLEPDPRDWRHLDDDPRFWEILDEYNLPPLPPEHPRYAKEQAYLRQKAAEAALAAQPLVRLSITLPPGESLAMDPAGGSNPIAISPDGATVVYASRGADAVSRLTLRPLGDLVGRVLDGTEGASDPFFSPDGQWVGYFDRRESKLKKVSVEGSAPVDLCAIRYTRNATYGAWGEDGYIVFSHDFTGLYRVPETGGEAERLTTPGADEVIHALPEVLPGGKAVVFMGATDLTMSGLWIEALRIGTDDVLRLKVGATNMKYSPTGRLIYSGTDRLEAAPFDAEHLEFTGPAVAMTEAGMARMNLGNSPNYFDLSVNGTLVYVRGADAEVSLQTLVWVDRDGLETPTGVPPRDYGTPAISPDGRRVAFASTDSGSQDLHVFDFDRTTTTRVTTDKGADFLPVWSRDGRRLVFSSVRESGQGIYEKSADGTGPAELLVVTAGIAAPYSWSSDGRTLLYAAMQTSYDLMTLSVEERAEPQTLLESPYAEWRGRVSPDGQWIAYESDESNQAEIYVSRFPEMTDRQIVSTNGGIDPRWSRDGDELFYRSGVAVMAVSVEKEPTLKLGVPQPLFDDIYVKAATPSYDVAPDGRFLMIKPAGQTQGQTQFTEIVVVKNWANELKRRVPLPEGN